MFRILANWYQKRFSDPDAVTLFLLLLLGFITLYFFSHLVGPILVALVLAYLLEWPTQRLIRIGCPRSVATVVVLCLFIGIMLLLLIGLLPTILHQGLTLLREAPTMLSNIKEYIQKLPQAYPDLLDVSLVENLLGTLQERILKLVGTLVSASVTSLFNIVVLMIYLVLVPIMVFFMLKDKQTLLASVSRFLPRNRALTNQVWVEMNQQIINYIRGKIAHILTISLVNYLVFYFMGINYALLLGVGVGLSVLIPYVGAMMITIPVVVVALFQWGVSPDFAYLMLAYGIVQTLDANLLVPLLFSEAMNLHPIAIIIAVLIFGGLWGFWGVFFAIPLATLVKAVLHAWPTTGLDKNTNKIK